MYWLALDLSSPTATLAIHRLENPTRPILLREQGLGDSYQHTERLLPALRELLNEAQLDLPDIERYLTVSGPGSFTGLRIAMSSLKAFAMVSQYPVETVSGSEARALAWLSTHPQSVGQGLTCLTFISSGRFVISRFSVEECGVALLSETVGTELVASEKEIVLNDARVPGGLITSPTLQDFPLRARYLSEQLVRAKSRRTFSHLGEWIAMTPAYFGAQHYDRDS